MVLLLTVTAGNKSRHTHDSISYPWHPLKAPMKFRWFDDFSPRYFSNMLAPILNPTPISLVSGKRTFISSTIADNSSVPPERQRIIVILKQ